MGTADAATASLLNGIQSNTTPSSGIIVPGGASNSISSQAYNTFSVVLGPYAQAAATGNWAIGTFGYTNGTIDNNHDFTFLDYDTLAPSINSATNPTGFPTGNVIAMGPTVFIPGTVQNLGNLNDSFNLTSGAISNWGVTFQCYNAVAAACGVGDLQFACHVGNITATPTVAANATYNICATFTPSTTVTTLTPLAWLITATSVGSSGVNNTTYDVLYPGGVLVAFRSYAVSACPGGVTPANSGVIPGCTITYTVTLVNEAPSIGATSSKTITPGTAVVTENGAATGNTWGTNTNGLTGIPIISACPSCTTTGVATSTNFTVTIPALAPQATAVYSYAVVVK
jgi:hypothetical protein